MLCDTVSEIESFYFVLMLAAFFGGVAVSSGLLRLADLDTMSKADLLQNFPLSQTPTVDRICTLAVPHFFESLRHSVSGVKPSLKMPNGDIVNVQMGRGFIDVHHSIECVEIQALCAPPVT